MSTPVNKLLFFNADGYPYNFNYDSINNQWNGKIFFDENSSDTFKSLCLYVFENVDTFSLNNTFDFRSSQLFNFSGMTFIPSTFTGETISKIEKVNNSPLFHSKWIYGDNFDKKFPVGTIIYFNNISGDTYLIDEFTDTKYFNVLGNKKNAFLITTKTNNKDFNFIFTGGIVDSLNVFKICDYGNQKLVDINNLNYYQHKKLSIDGTSYNDGIYTYNNYDVLKSKIYDFNLPDLIYNTGNTLQLDFYLMTQRPQLYEGNITIQYNDLSITGTTIEFQNYINTNINFITTGQSIIFENIDGTPVDSANPEFIITGFENKNYITTDILRFYRIKNINIIQTSSAITYTDLKINDYIEVISTPYISGYTLHDKRQFQIQYVSGNTIHVREYIIPESGYTYSINKIIDNKKVKKLYCQQNAVIPPSSFSGYTICYSTTNKITLSQNILSSGTTTYLYENTITALKNKYKSLLDRYGLDLYHYHYNDRNYLIFEGLDYNYNPYYSGVTAKINNNYLTVDNNFSYLNTGSTLQDSDVFYFSVFEKLPKYEKLELINTSKIAKNFIVEIYFDLYLDSIGYGFNLSFNNIDYYINISGSTNNYSLPTINNFIETYYDIFYKKGIYISSGYTNDIYTGYTLILQGIVPNIYFYDVEVKVNNYSIYSIIQNVNNNSVVIDSSELYLVNTDQSLYDYELSTGMIINISGSTNTINDKQYNILRITNNIIQLSYQGPFFYEYNSYINILVNNFLRKPRGVYDREQYYEFSWEPIEGNNPQISPDIFYYDYSGEQLLSNGNLTYIGKKPLWDDETDMVFLNKEPNKILGRVSDPQYQQTIFDSLTFKLEKLNSSTYYNYVPEPLQIFIGFNSKIEGVTQNNLILNKIDNIIFSGTTSNISGSTTYLNNFIIESDDTYSYINYSTTENSFSFTALGFEPNQHISLKFTENSVTGNTLFTNYNNYKITDVTDKRITVLSSLNSFDTSLSGNTYSFIIKTEPTQICSFNIYGQTEIEDERFVQHLKLLGAKLESDIQPIFKESDIKEQGIDYTILNRKRKELLTVYPEIYNYIGSYKALINAINFFGYNDLDLYEYYRNIKKDSPLYGKLQKIIIENIFDNTIDGWDEKQIDSKNYRKTNLFNLTYKITDIDGNYVQMYSLDDVQKKLTKLVKWLRKNIIPLSSNILDITGVASAQAPMYINYNSSNYVKKTIVNQENVAINFNYIQTLNIDNNYLFTINFYLTSGSTMPNYWTAKIKTFYLNESTRELEPVQYINLYKRDLLSFSFNIDKNKEPYMYIETQSYNDFGLGYTNAKLFDYNEGRNFILINNNFSGINYKYLNDQYGFYIITDGRFYVINF